MSVTVDETGQNELPLEVNDSGVGAGEGAGIGVAAEHRRDLVPGDDDGGRPWLRLLHRVDPAVAENDIGGRPVSVAAAAGEKATGNSEDDSLADRVGHRQSAPVFETLAGEIILHQGTDERFNNG